MTRYVILGAGAIGGTIGGLLAHNGHDVVLVARGAHAAALRADGLHLGRPDGSLQLPVEVAEVEELRFHPGDVLVVATKVQDAAALLTRVATRPGAAALPVVCAQNGVAGERIALRRFPVAYGMCVLLPATHLEPGVVLAPGIPTPGSLDLGRYPYGSDGTAAEAAEALQRSGFVCTVREEIMPWKYAKLLRNVGNAVQALAGDDQHEPSRELDLRARSEAQTVLTAAGLAWVPDDEWEGYRAGVGMRPAPIDGRVRAGGSSWQSASRGLASIESDYLNGEITLLGRLHGVATPVNALLQDEANALVARGGKPGDVDLAELLARL